MPKLPPHRAARRRRTVRPTPTAKAVRAALREQKVLELKSQGWTFREIGEALHISHTACENAYYRALEQISQPDAITEKTLQLERVGKIRKKVWSKFDPPIAKGAPKPGQTCPTCGEVKGPDHSIQAATVLVRLEERQSRLMGLDAPVKIDMRLGAPAKFNVDRKSRTEAVERLSIGEQRTLLYLVRKMRGEPLTPIGPYVPKPTNGNGHDPNSGPAPLDAGDGRRKRPESKIYRPGDPGYDEIMAGTKLLAPPSTPPPPAGPSAGPDTAPPPKSREEHEREYTEYMESEFRKHRAEQVRQSDPMFAGQDAEEADDAQSRAIAHDADRPKSGQRLIRK